MLRFWLMKTSAPLVLSVPNVIHKDIALKLLGGRWDVTEAPFDHTHVEGYSNLRLARLMTAIGWRETAMKDWLLETSDQHFPKNLPTIDHTLPIGNFLREFIAQANPQFLVNQFVRLYKTSKPQPIPLLVDRNQSVGPLFSILIVKGFSERILQSNNRLLTQQSFPDFQLILVRLSHLGTEPNADWAHSLPPLLRKKAIFLEGVGSNRATALNSALEHVTGQHVIVLPEGDSVSANWLALLQNSEQNNRNQC